jgi:flagellar biosynthesis anti-sigma factor FlgM
MESRPKIMPTSGDGSSSELIRMERVEAIRRAISEGRYHIDPAAIADRMLESARSEIRARLQRR